MSARERPDVAAFRELETLVRQLGDVLASHRKKAADAKAKEDAPARGKPVSAEKAAALESEGAAFKTRVSRAEERVKAMLDRVRFLRQQLQQDSGGRA